MLPHGRVEEGAFAGRLRVSVVVSPRLTPQAGRRADARRVPRVAELADDADNVTLRLRIGAAPAIDLERIWPRPTQNSVDDFFSGSDTPVAGFVFKNMAQVNLHSFAVRNVLGLLRKHYGVLAVQSASTHPTLLPWKNAHPGLKGMLTELGTRTQTINLGDRQIECRCPASTGSSTRTIREGLERRLGDLVFGPRAGSRRPTAGIGVDAQGNPVPARRSRSARCRPTGSIRPAAARARR